MLEVKCSIELLYDVKTWGICRNGGSRFGLRYGLVKRLMAAADLA